MEDLAKLIALEIAIDNALPFVKEAIGNDDPDLSKVARQVFRDLTIMLRNLRHALSSPEALADFLGSATEVKKMLDELK